MLARGYTGVMYVRFIGLILDIRGFICSEIVDPGYRGFQVRLLPKQFVDDAQRIGGGRMSQMQVL
ncbi:MAG: hypothetical protein R3C17_03490 [Planctomycetaceae bacterium]